MSPLPSLEGIVFDLDGTIAEVEELWRRACNETFAGMGASATWPDPERQWHWDRRTYRALMRSGGVESRITTYARDWLGRATRPEPVASLHASVQARFAAILDAGEVGLRPGIAELVTSARAARVRLAVATSMPCADAHAVLRAAFGADARTIFDAVVGGDDVARTKPAPDVYLQAVARLRRPPSRCVALEDSRNGVLAARAAGLRCVASPSLYTAGDDLSAADVRVRSFREVASVDALTDAATGDRRSA